MIEPQKTETLIQSIATVSNPNLASANQVVIGLIEKYKGDFVPVISSVYDGAMAVVSFGKLRFTLSSTFTLMGSDNPKNRFKSNPSEQQVKEAFQYLIDDD